MVILVDGNGPASGFAIFILGGIAVIAIFIDKPCVFSHILDGEASLSHEVNDLIFLHK